MQKSVERGPDNIQYVRETPKQVVNFHTETVESLADETVRLIIEQINTTGGDFSDQIEGISLSDQSKEDRLFYNVYSCYLKTLVEAINNNSFSLQELTEIQNYDFTTEKAIVEHIISEIDDYLNVDKTEVNSDPGTHSLFLQSPVTDMSVSNQTPTSTTPPVTEVRAKVDISELYPKTKTMSAYGEVHLLKRFSLNNQQKVGFERSLQTVANGLENKISRRIGKGYAPEVEKEIDVEYQKDDGDFDIAVNEVLGILNSVLGKNKNFVASLVANREEKKLGKDDFHKATEQIEDKIREIFTKEINVNSPYHWLKETLTQEGISVNMKFIMLIAFILHDICRGKSIYKNLRERNLKSKEYFISDFGYSLEKVKGSKTKQELVELIKQYVYAGSSKSNPTTHLVLDFNRISNKYQTRPTGNLVDRFFLKKETVPPSNNLESYCNQSVESFVANEYPKGGKLPVVLAHFIQACVIVDTNNLEI